MNLQGIVQSFTQTVIVQQVPRFYRVQHSSYKSALLTCVGDVPALLRVEDVPKNTLHILRDVTAAWPALNDSQLAFLLKELSLQQQRQARLRNLDGETRRISYSARELFERAKRLKHSAGVQAYTQLLVCLGNAHNAVLCEQYFEEMVANGITPTVATFSAMANCYAGIHNILKLQEIVHHIAASIATEGDVPALRHIYCIYLTCIAQEGGAMQTCEASKKLQNQILSGSDVALSVLQGMPQDITACLKEFIWMKDRGMIMGAEVYHALLEVCLASVTPTDAEGVLMMMKEDNLTPCRESLRRLLAVHCAVGEPTSIAVCVQRFTPSDLDHTILLQALQGLQGGLNGGSKEKKKKEEEEESRRKVAAQVAHNLLERYHPTSKNVLCTAIDIFCAVGEVEFAEVWVFLFYLQLSVQHGAPRERCCDPPAHPFLCFWVSALLCRLSCIKRWVQRTAVHVSSQLFNGRWAAGCRAVVNRPRSLTVRASH